MSLRPLLLTLAALGGAVSFPLPALSATCPFGESQLSTPASNFRVNGDGSVTHLTTGLVWLQCSDGQNWLTGCSGSATPHTWDEALTAVATLNGSPEPQFGGQSDWRLPTVKELQSLTESGCYGPRINDTVFPNSDGVFWSSTTVADTPGEAWHVDFATGSVFRASKASGMQLRMVRGGREWTPFTPGTLSQSISNFVATPPGGTVGATATLTATAGPAGTPVLFSSLTPATCSVLGNTVRLLAIGTCTVAADQAGGGVYLAAPQVTTDITVGKGYQSISAFTAPTTGRVEGFGTLSAAGGPSSAPVVFGSTTPTICTVTGNRVDYVTPGSCSVTADQAGDATYNAAPTETRTITVSAKAAQTITGFTATPGSGVVGGGATLSATSGGSSAPIIFGTSTPTICAVTGNQVEFRAGGSCTATADQAGDANYDAAPTVMLDITVSKAAQVITGFTASPSSGVAGGGATLAATGGGSSAPIIFGTTTASICGVTGNQVAFHASGTCTATADQAGDAGYNAAPTLTLDITVAKAPQVITGFTATPGSGVVGDGATLSATGGGSTAPVVFGSNTTGICTVTGNRVSFIAAGTCIVTADQAADNRYASAPQVELSIAVLYAVPTLGELALVLSAGLLALIGMRASSRSRRLRRF